MSLSGAVEALKVLRGKVADFFVIDKSLSISGACADAKAVGDALKLKASTTQLNGIKSDMSLISEKVDEVETIFGERGVLEIESESGLDSEITPGSYWVCTPNDEGMLLVYYSDWSGAVIQEFISLGGSIRRRMRIEDEWGEWEWENPPMEDGVEYRTTERWDGYPVYIRTKHLQTATAGSGDYSYYAFATTQTENDIWVVEVKGMLDSSEPFPVISSDGSILATVSAAWRGDQDTNSVEWDALVRTLKSEAEGRSANITVKYVKLA